MSPKQDILRFFLAFALLVATLGLRAASVTLGWNASTDPTATGYAVYWGTDGVTFPARFIAGDTTTFTISNLVPGSSNYFEVTAYNSFIVESEATPPVDYYVSEVTVQSSGNISTYGQPVTFSASVVGTDGGGSVSFYADGSGTPIPGCAALPLVNGTATTPGISTLSAGDHVITAVYTGDASTASSSGTLNGGLTVNPATLVVTATGVNKVYDGTTAASVILSDNRVPGDQLTDSYASATFASAGMADGLTIFVAGIGISGPAASNYILANTAASAVANIVSTLPTWVGADVARSSHWSDGTNWAAGTPPNLTGDNLVFSGNTGLTPVMDNSYTVASLTFAPTAGSFTLAATTGSTLTVLGAVNNNSSNTQYFSAPVALGAPSQWSVLAGAPLFVNSTVSGGGTLEKLGPGVLVLSGTNTYSGGTTIAGGTLALAGTGSINNTPQINLEAKAIFDVSAITNYSLSTNTALSATNAVILGATNGMVNLGAQPVTLSYNGIDPALTISQGVLVLSNNAFTVNSASPLPAGAYTLAQQSSGNIADLSQLYPAPTGTAIASGMTATISVSLGAVNLVIKNPASNPAPDTNTVNNTNNLVNENGGTNSDSTNSPNSLAPTNYVGAFALLVDGHGALSSHKALSNGKKYTLTAAASKGSVFAGWVSNGVVVSSTPKYSFVVQSNVQLQALFVTNPFIPVAGAYHGLFYSTNIATEASSGALACAVAPSGAYSAKISAGDLNLSFTGAFSVNGITSKTIVHAGATYTVQLQLDLNHGPITGSITTSEWNAQLSADPAVYSKATPAPEAGKYTLLIPGNTNSSSEPGGAGFAAVTVNPAGAVSINGVLGDGTPFACSTVISSNGAVPLYSSLYSGKGSVVGWLTLTNDAISGLVGWFKLPGASSKLYPAGFTASASAVGSSYHESNGAPILGSTDAELSLAGGSFLETVTNEIIFSSGTVGGDTAGDKFIFSESTGLFKGVVLDPATGKTVPAAGAVLQNENFAAGYFLDGGASGSVLLTPTFGQN